MISVILVPLLSTCTNRAKSICLHCMFINSDTLIPDNHSLIIFNWPSYKLGNSSVRSLEGNDIHRFEIYLLLSFLFTCVNTSGWAGPWFISRFLHFIVVCNLVCMRLTNGNHLINISVLKHITLSYTNALTTEQNLNFYLLNSILLLSFYGQHHPSSTTSHRHPGPSSPLYVSSSYWLTTFLLVALLGVLPIWQYTTYIVHNPLL